MKFDLQHALEQHRKKFAAEGRAFSAPARVNLIGEHTDYTGGFVMPAAIDFYTVAVVSPRSDGRAMLWSEGFGAAEYELAGLQAEPRSHWSDYPIGVAWALHQEGIALSGFNLSLSGNVPLGAGLSSSASVEVATAMALLAHARATLSGENIATLCRRAENEYVGAKSGIMDQFAVANAAHGTALLLDCATLKYELLPLPADVRIVICNSMVTHAVTGGEYAECRDQVEEGQAALRKYNAAIRWLRDTTVEDLNACRDSMSPGAFGRCRHIITENIRVQQAKAALLSGDMARFGELMAEAHISFRDDFAASCAEVDTLVEIARTLPGCVGSRITGGGFGGCTVNLVEADAAEKFAAELKRKYYAATGITAECYLCDSSDGAVLLNSPH